MDGNVPEISVPEMSMVTEDLSTTEENEVVNDLGLVYGRFTDVVWLTRIDRQVLPGLQSMVSIIHQSHHASSASTGLWSIFQLELQSHPNLRPDSPSPGASISCILFGDILWHSTESIFLVTAWRVGQRGYTWTRVPPIFHAMLQHRWSTAILCHSCKRLSR